MEKVYVIKDIYEESTYRVTNEQSVREMLKSFEFDYIKDRISDLYNFTKTSSFENASTLFEMLSSLNTFIEYYNKLNDLTFTEICQALENGYDITIYELGDAVHKLKATTTMQPDPKEDEKPITINYTVGLGEMDLSKWIQSITEKDNK